MALLIAMLMPPSLAGAEASQGKSGKAKEKSKQEAQGPRADDGPEFSVGFLLDFSTEEARRLAVRSELVGSKPLPPGIKKNLARGKPLPPGIAKQTLPDAYIELLPRDDDYVWRRAGADLVLIARTDGLVVEIAADVFR
jgi:hypothetical protein